MFEPVSSLAYVALNPKSQAIAIVPAGQPPEDVRRKWGARVAAALADDAVVVRDLVRDLLANPHVRVVVLDGEAAAKDVRAFWYDDAYPAWLLQKDHLTLVRQFVDLYDDDFVIKTMLPPYWPAGIRYET